jgi:hypothetical protein
MDRCQALMALFHRRPWRRSGRGSGVPGPGDDVFDGVENLIPGIAKRPRRSFPTNGDAPSRLERACKLWSASALPSPHGTTLLTTTVPRRNPHHDPHERSPENISQNWLAIARSAGAPADWRDRWGTRPQRNRVAALPSARSVDRPRCGWRLHLNCWASTSQPTMILEATAGNFSVDWRLVEPAAARFTRVCSHDRAGLAGAISVHGHEPCINRCGNCYSRKGGA